MQRIIIGLVGPIASGKGFLASHLTDLGFEYQSLSDRVRDEARLRSVELNRKNLQDIGNELREKFGGQVLAERTAILLLDSENPIVIDSIRNPGEIEFLRETLGVKIIGITAPEELRLEWYLSRSRERNEDGVSVEDFMRANSRDLGQGESISGQQVNKCLEMADYIIENNGSKEQLIEICDHLLENEWRGIEGNDHGSKETK